MPTNGSRNYRLAWNCFSWITGALFLTLEYEVRRLENGIRALHEAARLLWHSANEFAPQLELKARKRFTVTSLEDLRHFDSCDRNAVNMTHLSYKRWEI